MDNPFNHGMSIAELSNNRSGENGSISEEDDVMWNIRPNDPRERYDDENADVVICTLKIKSINEVGIYRKNFLKIKTILLI